MLEWIAQWIAGWSLPDTHLGTCDRNRRYVLYNMAGNVLIILIMIMIMISQISGELGEKKDVATEARRWLR